MILTKKTMVMLGGLACFSNLVQGAEGVEALKLEASQREEISKGIAYMKGKELVDDLLKQGFTLEDFSSKAFAEGFAEAIKKKDSEIKLEDFNG